MAHILIMPRQGNTVESCIITDWKVKEGDVVSAETIVCGVETDKAAFEVPAGAAGTVLKLLHDSGDDVPVLEPIAVIGDPGEDWQAAISQESSHKDAKAQREEENKIGTPTGNSSSPSFLCVSAPLRDEFSGKASPRARNLAGKEALPLETVPGTGPGGRIIERDVMAALKARPPLTAAAKAAGVLVSGGTGTGLGGRITVADLPSLSTPNSQLPTPYSPVIEGGFTDTPIKGIRKLIADRMLRSLAESAQLTLNTSAPAAKLLDVRAGFKARGGDEAKITVNDLVLFAVSRILPRFPFMNAHTLGEVIRHFNRAHLGVAVDTPRGLMVPVMRNANELSLAQVSAEAKRLASSCQDGSINPDDLSGSTFTVTNLGNLGITSFTPILNFPEVAILGVCNIEQKPIPSPNSQPPISFEPHIGFSLTINHQVVDGAPAARFLKDLCDAIASIDLLIASN